MSKVTFTVEAEQDDLPVRGNAIDSGDREYDKQVEDRINEELEWNVWAWASVKVTATIEVDGERFTGCNYLGACSYKDEKEFCQEGGYFAQMKEEALRDLRANLRRAQTRGLLAADALAITYGAES